MAIQKQIENDVNATLRFYKKDNTQTGMKDDQGKPDVTYVFEYFPQALKEVAKVSEFGDTKYERGSWVNVSQASGRYEAALERHLLDRYIYGEYDTESELLHLAHAAWNALAILELKLREIESQR